MNQETLNRVSKLITLGLNDAAATGEVDNCAVMLFRCLRSERVALSELSSIIGRAMKTEQSPPPPPPKGVGNPYAKVVITFGKYKGRSLGSVFPDDPSYFVWVVQESSLPDSKKAPFEGFLRAINYPF